MCAWKLCLKYSYREILHIKVALLVVVSGGLSRYRLERMLEAALVEIDRLRCYVFLS